MIEIKNVYKSYYSDVLNNINMKVEDGSIIGVVGKNGTGKTTLLKILAGVIKPNSGEVLYDGKPVFENVAVKKQILFMAEDLLFYSNSTPRSLYDLYRTFYDINYDEYLNNLKDFGIEGGLLSKLSKGLRRQVFLALALSIKPKYLLLDETFDGLDPVAKKVFKQKVLGYQQESNMTIIMTSHTIKELEDICDSCALINEKEISFNGYIDELVVKYHKYNIVFEKEYHEKDFDINFKSFECVGKIVRCVTTLELEEFKEAIKDKNPKLVEEQPIDLEEFVIIEESRKNRI